MIHQGRLRQPETDFQYPLDESAQDWLRVRIRLRSGQVRRFMVQYETTLAGMRLPVVRYDTAHGAAHRDLMNRRSEEVAKDFLSDTLPLSEALAHALRDLRERWPRYREVFLRDLQ